VQRLPLICAALLAAAAYLLGLGNIPLELPDEAREAEVAREMSGRGLLHVPTLNGEAHPAKPPLVYWLAAGVFSATSEGPPGEVAVRIVPVLATLALALTTFLLGRGWFSTRHGALAALLLLLSPHVLVEGRRFTTDPVVALFLTIAVGSSITTFRAVRGRRFLGFLACAATAVALGFLTKGPVVAALTMVTIAGVIAAERGVGGLFTLRALAILSAIVLFLAIAIGLWHWILYRDGGMPLLKEYWAYQSQRAFGKAEEPWWFYLPHAALGVLPWGIFLAFAGIGRSHHLAPGGQPEFPLRHLVIWAIVPAVVLSIAAFKRDAYILPIYPPLALIAASAILEPPRAGRPARAATIAWRAVSTIVVAVALIGTAGLPLLVSLTGFGVPWQVQAGLALIALATLAALRRDPEERAAPLGYPFTTAALGAVIAIAFVTLYEPIRPAKPSLRDAARYVAQIGTEADVYGYGLEEEVVAAIAYELARPFPQIRDRAELDGVLARSEGKHPRVVVMRRSRWEAEGTPGWPMPLNPGPRRYELVLASSRP
jgi:4-amino-4-deoxy-L-arabinose transferase-like glycosyltransferase